MGNNPVLEEIEKKIDYTVAKKPITLRSIIWKRFKKNKLALVGLILISILVIVAIFANFIAPYPATTVDFANKKLPPSKEHILGTDELGCDVLSRLIYGARISLSIGLVAVCLYVSIGILMGAISGFFGGWIDAILMRFTDVIISFPWLVLVILVAAILGPSIYNVMLIIGLTGWTTVARLVRGEFLKLKEMEYTLAARGLGANNFRIIFTHLLPNAFAPVLVAATMGVADAIIIEAALSFLGLGVAFPNTSWGQMMHAAQSLSVLSRMPWLWLPPGILISIAVLCINFIGDGLRDALDPKLIR